MNSPYDTNGASPSAHDLRLSREKALFLYWSALERGDLDVCERVMRDAERDPELQTLIIAAHEHDNASHAMAMERAETEVRQMLGSSLSAPLLSDPAAEDVGLELPPLTVADVAAQMHTETVTHAREQRASSDETGVLRSLSQITLPVPEQLSLRGVAQFLEGLGVAASERTQKTFRETALFLHMGRQQNIASMAATRRARQSHAEHKTRSQDEGESSVASSCEDLSLEDATSKTTSENGTAQEEQTA